MYREIKALLIIGSALLIIGCASKGGSRSAGAGRSLDRVMNESSDNLKMVMSENGRPSYIFSAPRVEGYTLGTEPYREFPDGVTIVTFTNDSLNVRESELTANYAIYYENRKLWEARGDVVVTKSDGKELYSQQLFWNAQTERIYSNVDTEIYDRSTGDTYRGDGFESDEAMVEWSFRKMSGRMKMAEPQRDTTTVERVVAEDESIIEEQNNNKE